MFVDFREGGRGAETERNINVRETDTYQFLPELGMCPDWVDAPNHWETRPGLIREVLRAG